MLIDPADSQLICISKRSASEEDGDFFVNIFFYLEYYCYSSLVDRRTPKMLTPPLGIGGE